MRDLRGVLPYVFGGLCCALIAAGPLSMVNRTVRTGIADVFVKPPAPSASENNWPFFIVAPGPHSAEMEGAIAAFIKARALPYRQTIELNDNGVPGFLFRMPLSETLAFVIEQNGQDGNVYFNYRGTDTGRESHALARQQADLWYGFINEGFPDHAVWEMLLGKQQPRYSRPARVTPPG